MNEMRTQWRRVRFGEVVRLIRESSKSPGAEGIERFIGLEHLESGDLRVRSWGDVTNGTTFTNRVLPGQVLFGKRRAYQRKVAVAEFDAVCSGDIYVFESADPTQLLPELLPFICQTDSFFDHAVGTSAGSLSPRTNWTSLVDYEFALPPLEEQHRLATVLSAVRGASESLAEAEEAGLSARKSLVLHLYCNGIRCEAKKPTPLGDLPKSWKVRPLGSRFEVQLGKMISEKARSGDGQLPYLRNANVQWNRLDLSDVSQMAFSKEERRKFELRFGDILACEGRHVGKSALWRDEIPDACYQKALHRLRPLNGDVPEYLLHCLYYYSLIGKFSGDTGETTIPHLPAERFRAMLFPFPSRDEQDEIAAVIAEMDASIDRLHRRLKGSQAILKTLMELP